MGLLATVIQGVVWAQPPTYRVTRVDRDIELSHNTVTNVTLDSRGFLWVSTIDGLNRYDGKSVKVYSSTENDSTSLSNGFIHGVYEYSEDELWISTRDGGLNILYPKTDKIDVISSVNYEKNGFPNGAINVLYKDGEGVFWLSFDRYSTGIFDRETNIYTPARLIEKNSKFEIGSINGLLELNDGSMIVSSFTGLYYIPETEIATFRANPTAGATIEISEIILSKGLEKPNTSELYLDQELNLWIREVNEGFRKVGKKELPPHVLKSISNGEKGSASKDMVIENDEYITMGGLNGAIVSINKRTEKKYYQKINEADESTGATILVKDYRGNVWVGVWGAGLYLLEEQKGIELVNKKQLGEALKSNFILGFEEEKDGFWIATARGLAFWDSIEKKVESFEEELKGFVGPGIWSMERDDKGLWLAGIEGGLSFIDANQLRRKKKLTAINYNAQNSFLKESQLHQIYRDSRGWLWLGYEGAGVQIITNVERWMSGEPANIIEMNSSGGERAISSDNIRKIYEDKAGNIWLATMDKGLVRILVKEQKLGRIQLFEYDENNPNSIGYDDTRSIYQQNDSTFWFATYGGGMTRWVESSNTFTRFRKEKGLPNNSTYGILGDETGRFIWISTNSGIARFDSETEKFTNFSESNGLQNLEFNTGAYLSLSNGDLLFGGVNGFNVIHPQELSINTHKPPVFITGINLFNDPIKTDSSVLYKKTLNLNYDQNFISFEFVALDFDDPSHNQFAYKMLGVDEDWVYSGNRNFASYPNIMPGKYSFKVKAANSDGVWNEQGTSISVVISPPWWGTIWFRALASIVFVVGFILVIRFVSQRNLRIQVRKMEMENKLRRERERISRDLHDHVGAQLANIITGLSLVDKYNQKNDQQNANRLVSSLQGDAQTTITQLRDTIWALNQKELDVGVFMSHLKNYFKSQTTFTELLEMNYNLAGDAKARLSSTQALNIFRITQEAAQNTLKYADAKSLSISMSVVNNELTLVIKDDGTFKGDSKGFEGGYGLGNMKKRAEELGGCIEVVTKNGTEVRVNIRL